MTQPPTEFAGQEKVRPPTASWMIWKKISAGGEIPTKVSGWAEAFPVKVRINSWFSASTGKFGVAEKGITVVALVEPPPPSPSIVATVLPLAQFEPPAALITYRY